jgi:hypothetical protein
MEFDNLDDVTSPQKANFLPTSEKTEENAL